MSEAVAVLHGAFGRVCLYCMDRSMVSHAHREGHLLFHIQGSPSEVYVDGRGIPLGPGQAVAVNPLQAHHYHQPVPGEQTMALVLYIRPAWFRNAIGGRASALRFGRAVEWRQRDHLFAACFDVAGVLVGRDRRQPVARPRQLVTGNRRRLDTDEHLAGPRLGPRDLLQYESLRVQP